MWSTVQLLSIGRLKSVTNEASFQLGYYVGQCFSAGGSRPKSGSQDRFEWFAECAVKETTTDVILFF